MTSATAPLHKRKQICFSDLHAAPRKRPAEPRLAPVFHPRWDRSTPTGTSRLFSSLKNVTQMSPVAQSHPIPRNRQSGLMFMLAVKNGSRGRKDVPYLPSRIYWNSSKMKFHDPESQARVSWFCWIAEGIQEFVKKCGVFCSESVCVTPLSECRCVFVRNRLINLKCGGFMVS